VASTFGWQSAARAGDPGRYGGSRQAFVAREQGGDMASLPTLPRDVARITDERRHSACA